MTAKYDYGETVSIYAGYFSGTGKPVAQTTVTVTITDSGGTEKVTDGAMTSVGTGVYSYTYAVPTDGPEGDWKYTTTGTDSTGVLTINTVHFMVGEFVVPFSSPDDVREILPDLLLMSENLGVQASGTALTLTSAALSVPKILKDDTNLWVSEDFTFIQPRTITLSTAADSENYTAYIHKGFTDEQLIKFIRRSDRKINNLLHGQNDVASDYKRDWSSMLTASYVLKITSKGVVESMNWATSLENVAIKAIESYIEKTGSGTTFDDSVVVRDDSINVPGFKFDQSDEMNFESDD